MFDSPLWERATYQLPGASFAERDGSYVNHADRLQSFDWAIRPPAGVWVEGQLVLATAGPAGHVQAAQRARAKLPARFRYFAAAGGEVRRSESI